MPKRLAWPCSLLLAMLLAPVGAGASASGDAGSEEMARDLRIAVVDANDKISLEDILGNRANVGFNPVLLPGFSYSALPNRTVWLRIRADFPGDGRPRFLSVPRQAIDSLRLYSSRDPGQLVAETGLEREHPQARWPDALLLPMPGDPSGTSTVYLAVKARGLVNLQPTLVNEEQAQEQASDARHVYLLLYGGLLLVGLLAIVRRWTRGESGYRLAQACFACLFAAMVDANHLQFSVGGSPLGERPNMPVALWIVAMGMLLRATSQYAGHEKNQPDFARVLDVVAWVFVALGIAALFVPAQKLAMLQGGGLVLLGVGALVACGSLFLDPRHWRWTPILIWIGVVLGLLALPLAFAQLMPLTPLVRRGFQLLVVLLLACYLLLPWVRQALRERAKLKRALVVEPTAEEKIAHAREWLMSSLQAGMAGAAEADMEWIAYRRLMAGLKPVLPQTAAAVIAMNYHNEDLLLVEPPPAEARFRMLLGQRASLLKNLSRSLAPQQIEIDFDGPEGPLDHVMLAVIPLPIERPGWGALVIERDKQSVYSDAELDLCAEFAALATTAADEAAEVIQQRHANEIEPESGAYRSEMTEQLLQRALEMSIQKRKPLALLRVAIDGFEQLPPQSAPTLVRSVADTIREEIDFGETIGRRTPDEFLVLLAGRAAGEVRGLAERICSEMRRHPLPGAGGPLTVSIGAAQMQPGERSADLAFERSAKALAKARSYGGNQAQMISGIRTLIPAPRPRLVIGNKSFSSWSLRPWLLLRHFGIDFDELVLPLDTPEYYARIPDYSPTGRVPAMWVGEECVWDSLAICETANERWLGGRGWPDDARARAAARSAASEMHSGFAALRAQLPFNTRREPQPPHWDEAAARDIARIQALWRQLREAHGDGEGFLCGSFGIVDAMFAPVCVRFRAYGAGLDRNAQRYMDAVFALPAMQAWLRDAAAEPETVDRYVV